MQNHLEFIADRTLDQLTNAFLDAQDDVLEDKDVIYGRQFGPLVCALVREYEPDLNNEAQLVAFLSGMSFGVRLVMNNPEAL